MGRYWFDIESNRIESNLFGLLGSIHSRHLGRASRLSTRILYKFERLFVDDRYLIKCLGSRGNGCLVDKLPTSRCSPTLHELTIGQSYSGLSARLSAIAIGGNGDCLRVSIDERDDITRDIKVCVNVCDSWLVSRDLLIKIPITLLNVLTKDRGSRFAGSARFPARARFYFEQSIKLLTRKAVP